VTARRSSAARPAGLIPSAVFDYRIRLIFLNETIAHRIHSIPVRAEEAALESVLAYVSLVSASVKISTDTAGCF
jgi:hypothetical protein